MKQRGYFELELCIVVAIMTAFLASAIYFALNT